MPKMHWYACSEVFYKGAIHWIASDDAIFVVLCFDLSSEIFRSILMPDCCDYFDGKCYGLVLLNESLTLVCYPDPGNDPQPGKESTDIWLMNEYGDLHSEEVKEYNHLQGFPRSLRIAIYKESLTPIPKRSDI
ncbi:hypothetical protein KY285_001014 [Solanum tuberosum]|nr:hypothetical protein KY285_001014 [Solanum tuberosum]